MVMAHPSHKATEWQVVPPILTALGLGLSVQAEIFFFIMLFQFLSGYGFPRKNITKKQILVFVLSLLIAVGTMILNEFKFGFRGIEGMKPWLWAERQILPMQNQLEIILFSILIKSAESLPLIHIPEISDGEGAVIILGIYSLVKRDKIGAFLTTWLFAHIWVVTVGGVSTPFLMVGIGPAVSLTIAYFLSKFKSWVPIVLILFVLVFGNLSMSFKENSRGSTLFAIQKDMLLSKQIAAIDYTYKEAEGKEFSINTLTSPLWINIVWSYLYKWYGLPKYGYLPSFHGHDQIGQIDALNQSVKPKQISFLIIEPMGGIPMEYLGLTIGEEDSKTNLIDEKYFGELRVQKRVLQCCSH